MSPLGFPVGLGLAAAKSTGYQIGQSLRFDGSSYLSWTPGSAGNRRTSTFSVWFKPTTTGGEGVFLNATGYTKISIDNGGFDKIWFLDYAGGFNFNVNPSGSYRDPSAWYHLVAVLDTTNATSTERVKIYINGVRLDTFDTNSQPSQNFETDWANNVQHRIGADTNPFYFNGYMAECHFVETALDPTDFGKFDNNGVWTPVGYTGSYGANGFYLKFDPSATNGIGHDHSGNGNNFSPTGFTTSGTGTDVMSDTPTKNYATFNPLQTRGSSLSNGNLDASFTISDNNYASYITQGITSGKYYFEVTCTSSTTSASLVGFVGDNNLEAKRAATNNAVPGLQGTYGRGVDGTGTLYDGSGGNDGSYMAAWSQNDVIMIAIDADNGKFWLGANGNWANGSGSTNQSGLIAAAEISLSSSTTPYLFGVGDSSGSVAASFTLNAGQRAFAHTPPTGYSALNTSNLPAPTVKDGSKNFNTVLYTGDSAASHAITGVGFQPDFLWIKRRNGAQDHQAFDAVRGADKSLQQNETNAESDNDTHGSFDSDGFTLTGAGQATNNSGGTYVAWNWLAGGSGSSNTAGSITSTVSANPSAGFSIVSYTGTGANATIGHGLGVAPKMVIVKSRDTSPSNWLVYHSEANTGNPGYMYLDLTLQNQIDSGNGIWNNTRPTSTVFSVGNYVYTNKLNDDFIAYCFAEVEGYSKFTSYTGNNNNDGVFCYLGFKPSWLLIKGTNSAYWYIWDEQRSTYNTATKVLLPSDVAGEQDNTTRSIDFLSNGFKLRTNDININANGQQYIVAAFASNPFGGSGVSPATAR